MNPSRNMLHTVLIKTIILIWVSLLKESAADPQINLLNRGCSPYNVTNRWDFNTNLNATFLNLMEQLNKNNHFATSQQAKGSDPVYAIFQCRKYQSMDDCITCFTAAMSGIRNCVAANGARVTYDGCFLR